jgi:hypothetical protein
VFRYAAFGEALRSELEFPELREAADEKIAWTVLVSRDEAPPALEREVGRDEVEPGVPVVLLDRGESWILRYADTGAYLVNPQARTITWHRVPGAQDANARLDLLGRVFAVALHAVGTYVLHGGAVAIGDRAVAFVAPKRAGKSTLVAHLVAAGAQFISDDSVPIALGRSMLVLPCGRSIRLLSDSFARLSEMNGLRPRDQLDVKEKPSLLISDHAVRTAPAQLDAIYVLSPSASSQGSESLKRERLPGPRAAAELIRHSKLGALLGATIGSDAVERAVVIASVAPVFALTVPQDFAQSSMVVSQLFDWHGGVLPPQPAVA